ncbi:MAG TPA: prolyl oligopeptidase family serine peptidase [Chitinophagaceae bacterium]|nr:prolyl oligopeptidase family serine peptidase [Chitinophagaceae bacterium]
MRIFSCILFLLFSFSAFSQKKTLDHTVYDKWESIGERRISNDGKWAGYVKAVQEGDDELLITAVDGSRTVRIPRGYNLTFNSNSSYAVLLIKPLYADTRDARIKKKKPEDMPRDSLAIVNLSNGDIQKTGGVRSYKLPENAPGPLAYLMYKQSDSARKTPAETDEGAELRIDQSLNSVVYREVKNVTEYEWNENGKMMVLEGRRSPAVQGSVNAVIIYRALEDKLDTICRGGNDFGNFAIDSNAYQVAFTAERDSSRRSLQKFHKLWYWKNGMDSAVLIADKNSMGMKLGWTISENRDLMFSSNGSRLYFGTAPIKAARDTSIPDIDRVKLDIWHYNDERLQPQQLVELSSDEKRSYLAMFDLNWKKVVQLGDEKMKDVVITKKGDADQALGFTSDHHDSQWTGEVVHDVFAINVNTGRTRTVVKGIESLPQLSPKGNFISWYDTKKKHFFTWRDSITVNVSAAIPYKLYDEEHDTPNDPEPYSRGRWLRDDDGFIVQDRYDVWKLDPAGRSAPINITKGSGRKTHNKFSYFQPVNEDKEPENGSQVMLRSHHEDNKQMGLYMADLNGRSEPLKLFAGPFMLSAVQKAKNTNVLVYTKESFTQSPDLYLRGVDGVEKKITSVNPQQSNYNWGTVELFRWKAYNGKDATGMIFKPENFVEGKKYPMISYFYERLSDSLYKYRPPAPTRSNLDIMFFVSRGYIVFVPDIRYQKGYPGKGAYDYVVSGARAVVKKGWADSTRLGLQGQSWGGYQICYLITRTKLFAAAWAGAPVANMTSAYGGIRWGSGLNRQFQYEKTQSRIGATLWEKQNLYIENSPLFYVPRITTPLMIMANDEDDAVPWWQGIEMFTAMRRNGKKVWLLNYNGEKHGLLERKNKKDISVREQQFFDWLLKGEKPPRWISDGVPAVEKQNVNL